MADKPVPSLLEDLKRGFAERDRAGINATVRALDRQSAPIGNHWRTLADVMLHNGEITLARAAIERFVRHHNGAPAARFLQASVLARSGAVAQARDLLATLPQSVPDPAGNAFSRGTMELNLGNLDAAREHLLRAVAANPRLGQAWLGLASTGRLGGGPGIAERILAAAPAMAAAARFERAQYAFARGKILDEQDDIDGAFAAFAEGGRLVLADIPYDRAADAASARDAIAGYDAAAVARWGGLVRADTSRPILVTGSPRSGTTLVEQILASHSRVTDGEELGRFQTVAEDVGGTSTVAIERWIDRGGSPDAGARLYMHLFSERFGRDGRAIDKTTDASRYLGLAASFLPAAPIVWLRRDPLDRALSCFRNVFLRGAEWSYRLEDIAYHFALEDGLLARWQDILGDRLFVLDYEALTRDPVAEIPRLLAHCGLDPEPGVFEPHKADRAVTTASVAQVREPISTRAIGAAERYRAHLQPFVDAYRAAGGTID